MKKLYEVERRFYVLAEDEAEAESYSPLEPLACTNFVYEATSIDQEWWDSLPFGDDEEGERTCGQIMQSLKTTLKEQT